MFDARALNKLAPYSTEEEIQYLETLNFYPKSVVMLGAGPGVFALSVCKKNMKTGKFPWITLVDISTCHYAEAHLAAMGVPAKFVHSIISDSAEAGKTWEGRIGLLIVDADHSTEAVLRDIDAWFSHVSPGGYIFFHDYLERPDGFNGSGEWFPGQVALALAQREYLPWSIEAYAGISVIYRKDK